MCQRHRCGSVVVRTSLTPTPTAAVIILYKFDGCGVGPAAPLPGEDPTSPASGIRRPQCGLSNKVCLLRNTNRCNNCSVSHACASHKYFVMPRHVSSSSLLMSQRRNSRRDEQRFRQAKATSITDSVKNTATKCASGGEVCITLRVLSPLVVIATGSQSQTWRDHSCIRAIFRPLSRPL